MYTLKVLSKLFALIFCIFMLYGCGSDSDKGDLSIHFVPVTPEAQSNTQPEPEPSNISLSVDKLDLEPGVGTSTIQIKADCAWRIGFGESSNTKAVNQIDWIKAEPSSGTGNCEVTLTFEDNRTLFEDRVCKLFVISELGTTVSASIKQECVTYENAKEGYKIVFGRYPQSYQAFLMGGIDDVPNSYEPLTWVVDSKKNNEIYMTTEKIIEYMPMCTSDSFINSQLRDELQWMLYDPGFNDEEKSIMGYFNEIDSPISLFKPNVPYFETPESRRCQVTYYARSWNYIPSNNLDDGCVPYWCDYDQTFPDGDVYASCINLDGSIGYTNAGQNWNYTSGVRPRIKIKCNNSNN